MMSSHTDTLAGVGGALHYQDWRPDGVVRAVLVIVHGAAEHGGRYAPLAEQAVARGMAVATVDLPGHGQSDGARCSVAHMNVFVDAVQRADATIRQRVKDAMVDSASATQPPYFLLGHSMGGLVAALHLEQSESMYAGAVFSGPALALEPPPPRLQVAIVNRLAKWLPTLGVVQLDANLVSRDERVVKRYREDPLVYGGKLTASLVAAMFAGMARAQASLPMRRLPILALHGGADGLVPPAASELLVARAGSDDMTRRVYPGLYHEVFNEPEGATIIDEMLDWVEARASGSAT
ncbi:MAG: lysophospholipase [Pseudomonadota bacterium]